ncbi:MAG: family 2B encapsulin nanocompartment shell protein [Verrucomicrobiota bacterium]
MSATVPQTHLSLSAAAARNLATATVTVRKTPRARRAGCTSCCRGSTWTAASIASIAARFSSIRAGLVTVEIDGKKVNIVPESLRGIPLFSGLDIEALRAVAAEFATEQHDLGKVIAKEGDTGKKLYVVARGKLALTVVGPHGTDLRQGLLGEGNYYGDDALLGDGPKLPAIRTLTPATLLTLDRSKFDAFRRKAGVRDAIEQALAERKAAEEKANEYGEAMIDLLTVHAGEPKLPTTFVDYEEDPREYHLSTIQTVLQTHTRVTDLYSNRIDQLREQVRLTVEAVKEWEEWELINNPDFGLLREVAASQRIPTRSGPPTPDDLDDLLALVWKKPAFFLAHPRAIAAFGRECTRRGVPPPTVNLFGSPFVTWRGVPLVPSDKLLVNGHSNVGGTLGSTSILLLRVGEGEQGVVGLQKAGVTGEVEPGLSVRYMGTNENSIASHLVTRYFSAAVLTDDAIARLDNVLVGHYHDYVYPR